MAEKKKKDDVAVADLIRRGTPAAPIKMATDGGMHQVFAEALQGGREVRGKDGEVERVPVSAPGTIPPTVNPPANVLAAATPAPAPAAAPAPSTPASRSIVARAPAKPAQARTAAQPTPAAQPTQTASADPIEKTRNFLNSLFTSNSNQTQTASAAHRRRQPPSRPLRVVPPRPPCGQPHSLRRPPSRNPPLPPWPKPSRRHCLSRKKRRLPAGGQCRRDPAAVAGVGLQRPACRRVKPVVRRRARHPGRQLRQQLVRLALIKASADKVTAGISRPFLIVRRALRFYA